MRAEPDGGDRPVILLTDHPVNPKPLMDLRIDYVLQKPFSPRELTSLAETLLS
jgi:hypothetical protein